MKRLLRIGAVVFVGTLLLVGIARGGEIYYHLTQDIPTGPPPEEPYWEEFTGLGGLYNTSLWLGATNIRFEDRIKVVDFIVKGSNLDKAKFKSVGGWQCKTERHGDLEHTPNLIRVKFNCYPQPDGEWLKLSIPHISDPAKRVNITSVKAPSLCYKRINKGKKFTLDDAWEHNGSSIQTSEYWLFPEVVPVDTSVAPGCIFPTGSGNWSYEWVYQDPYGNPQPQGGVKWTTDGTGVNEFEHFTLDITMMETADLWYSLYTYDDNAGEYYQYPVECPEPATVVLLALGGLALLRRRKR